MVIQYLQTIDEFKWWYAEAIVFAAEEYEQLV